jgi:RNA polymerase sigma factor (sigma-70 family)
VAGQRFEDFFAKEYAAAVRLAGRLGPAERAEDVAAEAFERVYRHWDAVEQPAAYLRTAVRSIVTDELRRAGAAQRSVHTLPSVAPAPDDAVATQDELSRALRSLAPRQRTALVLRYGLDLSESDVARRMGVSAGTVKSTTSRALSSLRDIVGCCPEAA